MNNLTGFLNLIGGASKLASLLTPTNEATYAADIAAIKADGEKLLADMAALAVKIEADAKTIQG